MRREFRQLFRECADFCLPPHCPGCGRGGVTGLCGRCRQLRELRLPPLCERCGAPVSGPGAPCAVDHRRFLGLGFIRAPLVYRGTGGALVRRLKFEADRAALRLLVTSMAARVEGWARGPGRRAVCVPVPLHPRKRARRGLDQAALLAEGLARSLGLGLQSAGLRRVRDTLPQGDVRVTSRQQNVADAFAPGRRRGLDGAQVVLVDDVCTSGATAVECGRVLRRMGVRKVHLLTAAQA